MEIKFKKPNKAGITHILVNGRISQWTIEKNFVLNSYYIKFRSSRIKSLYGYAKAKELTRQFILEGAECRS